MKGKATFTSRIVLGLIFFVFGLNGLLTYFGLNFIPVPTPQDPLMKGIMESGYLMTTLKIIETICGFLLLADLYVPLALTILCPIVVNIFLYHLFLHPTGLAVPLLLILLMVLLLYGYKGHFLPLLKKKNRPSI